ncbi:CRISPR-associated helicase Cas3' [Macrococcus carouselicus]|uniref:CRISPR-associated helicase Cas3 n=1 Tax=Macrococcus carouselicus TaxID=69969 RepID=A0A9Q8CM81_9STAP|nr:CRISPR-associated helicase Cas3' [Macrococcus carouselicus]TDM04006.1 CRISPR-associated helicase Cas3' [Macrococcus carouselicus]
MKLIAHIDQNLNKVQLLEEHLINVAKNASLEADKVGLKHSLFLLGLLHDAGKSDRLFQHKLKVEPSLHVNHSSAGAKYLLEYINREKAVWPEEADFKLFQEYFDVLLYVITAHHGLYDILRTDSRCNFLEKRVFYDTNDEHEPSIKSLKNKIKDYHYSEDVQTFVNSLLKRYQIDLTLCIKKSFEEYKKFSKTLETEDVKEAAFYSSLKVRLMLSYLKNADIEDTINAYGKVIEPLKKEAIDEKKLTYLNAVETHYRMFGKPTSEINKIRSSLAENAFIRGRSDQKGIYQLNLPTGAGKTLISLRYGMQQLVHQNKDRFIYITPFLSVLEQNAAEIKNILKDKDITEHHSNVIQTKDNDTDEKDEILKQYLQDTWSSPVILSTMVQFFQTLFTGKSNNIRRFSSLANSVIILDEVQSLPAETVHLFNMTLNFIAYTMQSTIILCTATQPLYNSQYIQYKIRYQDESIKNIVHLTGEERQIFDRTEVHNLNQGEPIDESVIIDYVKRYENDSILVILNTKKAVKKVIDALEGTERPLYYLSTNLCPKHRQNIIAQVQSDLNQQRPVICVSTQLIEAGVDVDFQRLIRSYAGIDSIVQSMGRCNRNGNYSKGYVQLAKTVESFENLESSALRTIRDKVQITERLIGDYTGAIDMARFNDVFYEYYYANHQSLMDFPLGKDQRTGVSLLSTNENLSQKSKILNGLRQSFQTAGSKIRLINNQTTGIIVYYQNSKELIEDLIRAIELYEQGYDSSKLVQIKNLLNQLQPYTISVYDFNAVRDKTMSFLDDQVYILTEGYYNDEVGLVEINDDFIF